MVSKRRTKFEQICFHLICGMFMVTGLECRLQRTRALSSRNDNLVLVTENTEAPSVVCRGEDN